LTPGLRTYFFSNGSYFSRGGQNGTQRLASLKFLHDWTKHQQRTIMQCVSLYCLCQGYRLLLQRRQTGLKTGGRVEGPGVFKSKFIPQNPNDFFSHLHKQCCLCIPVYTQICQYLANHQIFNFSHIIFLYITKRYNTASLFRGTPHDPLRPLGSHPKFRGS